MLKTIDFRKIQNWEKNGVVWSEEKILFQQNVRDCSKHFENENIIHHFGQCKLREGAIPKKFDRNQEKKNSRKLPAIRNHPKKNQ